MAAVTKREKRGSIRTGSARGKKKRVGLARNRKKDEGAKRAQQGKQFKRGENAGALMYKPLCSIGGSSGGFYGDKKREAAI